MLKNSAKLVVFKILASDVLPMRDLSLSGASNKRNEYMGAYNLSEKTGWVTIE